MSTQISLKLSDRMIKISKKYMERKGYDSLQDLLRELLREKLFDEPVGGLFTYKASGEALAKNWSTKEEDKAWAHLQKET